MDWFSALVTLLNAISMAGHGFLIWRLKRKIAAIEAKGVAW